MYLFPRNRQTGFLTRKINERVVLKLIINRPCFLYTESSSVYPEAAITYNSRQFDASKSQQSKPNMLHRDCGGKSCESPVSQSLEDGRLS